MASRQRHNKERNERHTPQRQLHTNAESSDDLYGVTDDEDEYLEVVTPKSGKATLATQQAGGQEPIHDQRPPFPNPPASFANRHEARQNSESLHGQSNIGGIEVDAVHGRNYWNTHQRLRFDSTDFPPLDTGIQTQSFKPANLKEHVQKQSQRMRKRIDDWDPRKRTSKVAFRKNWDTPEDGSPTPKKHPLSKKDPVAPPTAKWAEIKSAAGLTNNLDEQTSILKPAPSSKRKARDTSSPPADQDDPSPPKKTRKGTPAPHHETEDTVASSRPKRKGHIAAAAPNPGGGGDGDSSDNDSGGKRPRDAGNDDAPAPRSSSSSSESSGNSDIPNEMHPPARTAPASRPRHGLGIPAHAKPHTHRNANDHGSGRLAQSGRPQAIENLVPQQAAPKRKASNAVDKSRPTKRPRQTHAPNHQDDVANQAEDEGDGEGEQEAQMDKGKKSARFWEYRQDTPEKTKEEEFDQINKEAAENAKSGVQPGRKLRNLRAQTRVSTQPKQMPAPPKKPSKTAAKKPAANKVTKKAPVARKGKSIAASSKKVAATQAAVARSAHTGAGRMAPVPDTRPARNNRAVSRAASLARSIAGSATGDIACDARDLTRSSQSGRRQQTVRQSPLRTQNAGLRNILEEQEPEERPQPRPLPTAARFEAPPSARNDPAGPIIASVEQPEEITGEMQQTHHNIVSESSSLSEVATPSEVLVFYDAQVYVDREGSQVDERGRTAVSRDEQTALVARMETHEAQAAADETPVPQPNSRRRANFIAAPRDVARGSRLRQHGLVSTGSRQRDVSAGPQQQAQGSTGLPTPLPPRNEPATANADQNTDPHPRQLDAVQRRMLREMERVPSQVLNKRPPRLEGLNKRPQQQFTIFVCGDNRLGQLGLGESVVEEREPVVNEQLTKLKVVDFECGANHCIALTKDGKVLTWGRAGADDEIGARGALGTSWINDPDTIVLRKFVGDTQKERMIPKTVDLRHLLGERGEYGRIVQVVATNDGSFALTDYGTVLGWGTFMRTDEQGQYAAGLEGGGARSNVHPSTIKQRAMWLADWNNMVKIAAGGQHILALDATGEMHSMGDNSKGQLGLRRYGERNRIYNSAYMHRRRCDRLPTGARPVNVACGENHSFAIDDAGRLYAWGDNAMGQLGTGSRSGHEAQPQLVPGWHSQDGDGKRVIEEAKVAVDVCGGISHSLACTKDGQAYSWGQFSEGATGILREDLLAWHGRSDLLSSPDPGSEAGQSRDATPDTVERPRRLPDCENITRVCVGSSHSILVDGNGTAFSFGRSEHHQTGQGYNEVVQEPEEVQGSDISQMKVVRAAGGEKFTIFACVPRPKAKPQGRKSKRNTRSGRQGGGV